jgi:hypothetical protein
MKKVILCICLLASLAFCADGLLLNVQLAGGTLGLGEHFSLSGPQLGLGTDLNRNISAGFSIRSFEMWMTPWPGDYMYKGALLVPYLYLINGLHLDKKVSAPIEYLYFSGDLWSAWGGLYKINEVQVGIGIKWTIYALSPALEAGCIHARMSELTDYEYIPYIRLSLELGGWWRIGR